MKFKQSHLWNYLNGPKSTYSGNDGPLRMPIVERDQETGTIVIGKIVSGYCRVGDRCLIMPNRTHVQLTNIYYDNVKTNSCVYGDNVRLKLKNIEEEETSPGFILCGVQQDPCGVEQVFDAQVVIVEHKSIICPVYSAVLHIHVAKAKVQLKQLITLVDHKTDEKIEDHPRFIKQGQVAIARFELLKVGKGICMELFGCYPQLG